jgi:hypothetical protein
VPTVTESYTRVGLTRVGVPVGIPLLVGLVALVALIRLHRWFDSNSSDRVCREAVVVQTDMSEMGSNPYYKPYFVPSFTG